METRYLYVDYCNDIQLVLSALLQANTGQEQVSILKELSELDHRFVLSQSAPDTNVKKIFFTRHGLCSISQKALGFAPNTSVEESALLAMQDTSKITHSLFPNDNENCRIAISPMVRAKQTAGKLIPDQFKGVVEIANFLTESSISPSGKPLFSVDDLQNQSDDYYIYIASMYYDESYFEELRQKSSQANKIIEAKANLNENSIQDPANYIEMDDVEKINHINLYIADNQGDIWFIGHGKNTRNYFEKRYLIDKDMEYCETRKILCYTTQDGVTAEFVAPYCLTVNQETGLFQGSIFAAGMKPVMYTNPINELEQYIIDRRRERDSSVQQAVEGGYSLLKDFTLYAKKTLRIDFEVKISVAEKLIAALNGNNTDDLTDEEKTAVNDSRLGNIVKKYDLNLDVLFNKNGFNKKVEM